MERKETTMLLTEGTGLKLGPGNEILPDDPQNQQFLERLQNIPPLTPPELLELAKWYEAYPTLAAEGSHFALVALATGQEPRVQQDAFANYLTWEEGLEYAVGWGKDTTDPNSENTEFIKFSLQRATLPNSSVQVLVETVTVINAGEVERRQYFLIGF
jgi:hypothetical protein